MGYNVNEIIANALQVDKTNFKNMKSIIRDMYEALKQNKDAIMQTCSIDKKNNNGFILDFEIISRIFTSVEKERLYYGKVMLSQKDDEKQIVYGKEIFDKGLVVLITNGNPYVDIELIWKNLLVGNTIILANNGYMYGTYNFLVNIIQAVLEVHGLNIHLLQLYVSEKYDELLNNYANIDLVVCVGSHSLQREILFKSKSKTLVSGYENYDIYLEDATNLWFVDKIIDTGANIQFYIKQALGIDHPNAIIVNDIDEAIAQINYNGHHFNSAIFTENPSNASKFIKLVKSNMITVNTSPTIERICDIKLSELCIEKTIVYPLEFNFNEKFKF